MFPGDITRYSLFKGTMVLGRCNGTESRVIASPTSSALPSKRFKTRERDIDVENIRLQCVNKRIEPSPSQTKSDSGPKSGGEKSGVCAEQAPRKCMKESGKLLGKTGKHLSEPIKHLGEARGTINRFPMKDFRSCVPPSAAGRWSNDSAGSSSPDPWSVCANKRAPFGCSSTRLYVRMSILRPS